MVRPEQLWVDEGQQVLDHLEAYADEEGRTEGGQQGPQEGGLPGPGPAPQQHLILPGRFRPRCRRSLVSGSGRKEPWVEMGTYVPRSQAPAGAGQEQREGGPAFLALRTGRVMDTMTFQVRIPPSDSIFRCLGTCYGLSSLLPQGL